MKPTLKSTLVALGIAAATLASAPAFADKWNMPVRSNERNYFTRNIMQFADEVKAMAPWNIVVVNDRIFKRLDKKTQDAVLAASKTAEERGWKLRDEETGKLVQTLKDKGMDVRQPSPALMTQLQKIGEQLVAEWSKSAGADGPKILEQYKSN